MLILNLSIAELGPIQSALMRKKMADRLIVLERREGYFDRSGIENDFLWDWYSFFTAIIFDMSYYKIMHQYPFTDAILCKLFNTALLPFLARQLGVYSRYKTMQIINTIDGKVQNKVVTTLQSWKQQYPTATKTPATPNEHCRISEYFCLKW